MKRLSLLALLVVALIVVACASPTPEPTKAPAQPGATSAPAVQPTTAAPAQAVEIEYWQYFFESKKNLVDELIVAFQKENPNIKIVHTTFPYEQYNEKVAASVPAGRST